jgi:uncharacterized membrane-anchored protein
MATTTFSSAYAQHSTRGNGRHVLRETFREKYGRAMSAAMLAVTMLALLTGSMMVLYRAGMGLGDVSLIVASVFIGGAMFTAMLILLSAGGDQR